MNIKWLYNRLRAMGGAEIAYRISKTLRSQLERRGFRLAVSQPPSDTTGTAWIRILPSSFEVAAYRARADQILSGQFDVFALRGARLGFPPDWNRDPKTGIHAPLTFGKSINYRDEALVGDIKYLWEPNRHAELVSLAQAWRLTGDTRYSQGCATLIDSWLTACPYPKGVNWTSSLELALRLVNWAFAWHLLDGDAASIFSGDSGHLLRDRWLQSVREHCHFIAGYLSRHSSANNHLLGELLGLYVASVTWPRWRESPRWREFAQRQFEQQALLQNSPDGVNLEQAIWYHHEVADMMLIALLFDRGAERKFSTEFRARWFAMLEYLAAIMDVGGHVPHIGDADDAVIARLDPRPGSRAYRSLLASGAVLASHERTRIRFKFKAGNFDEKSRWLLGDNANGEFAAIAATIPEEPRRSYPLGGYYLLGDEFDTPSEVRIVADAAPLGYLSIAAHGHADALAFTLSVAGLPILIDPGTYAYHTQKIWRDYFRGTPAHNTATVDGLDQSVHAGNFMWSRHARVRSVTFESNTAADRLQAEHDGYMRLADPVLHQRELLYSKAERILRIGDRLTAQASHELELNWHFAPECSLDMSANILVVQRAGVAIQLAWPAEFAARIARGEEQPPRGWMSSSFDVKVPCDTLVLRRDFAGSLDSVCEIRVLSVPE